MIDKIKFYIENLEIKESVLRRIFTKSFYKNEKQFYLADYNEISFFSKSLSEIQIEHPRTNVVIKSDLEDSSYNKTSYRNLFISYSRDLGNQNGRLTIYQNIRRDFFKYKKLSAFKDLNYHDFIEIINLYADEFEVPREDFWNAKITQLELGVNLRFNMNISSIINSISKMKGIEKPLRVDNSSINFRSSKYEIAIYDKLDRAIQQKEIFGQYNKVTRKRLFRKISRRNSFVRFELRIKKLSQFNRRSFKGKLSSLQVIKKNFNDIGKELYNLITEISFVNVINPEIDRNLVKSQLKGKSVHEFNKYLRYLGLKYFGVVKFIDFARPILNSATRNKYLNDCEKLFNDYRKTNDYVKKSFQRKLYLKIQRLTNDALAA